MRRLAGAGILVLLAVIGAFMAGQAMGPPAGRAQPISYWLGDGRTVGAQVIAGPRSFCGIVSVDESSSEVRIRIECRDPLGVGSSAIGVPYGFLIQLQAPLNGRQVLDGDGNPGTLCSTAGCLPSD